MYRETIFKTIYHNFIIEEKKSLFNCDTDIEEMFEEKLLK